MILSNEGRSLILRQTTPDDVADLLKAYDDEAFIRLYRSNNQSVDEEQLRQALEHRAQIAPAEMAYVEFMIVHKQHGNIGIAALGDYSALHQRAEYLVGLFDEEHRYAGRGIEATLLILDLAFNIYKLHKVYSYVYEYNEFSQKNMVHLGFKAEGRLDHHHYLLREKRFIDLYINGMTMERFRNSEKIQKISPRLVGRDITQEYPQLEVNQAQQLPVTEGHEFLEKMRELAQQQEAQ
ncbi:GNAT family N-acetyltransferase [Candidatus Venteria ishoeyi]|uniref:N-acetyltransferase domain-containing protein n=1 Tax=Candidatus Venteria ishoeyi TaxID=1899563 RepID=A0A1H6FHP6_9GAMM|nr:GNAT family protein [Candidatus Venteria ishoeyi]SEH08899.1 Uncharacterised protein [Candidatus Venteria ishoeyi]